MPATLPQIERPIRHGTCTLTMRIDQTDYRVSPLRDETGEVQAWRLRKVEDGTVYTTNVFCECTCPDYLYVQRPLRGVCKHVRALEALGLLQD